MLPNFRAGQKLDQMSAAALNELVAAGRAFRAMSAGAGIAIDWVGGIPTVRLADAARPGVLNERRVVVRSEPTAVDQGIEVQAVTYRDLPPRENVANCDDVLEPTCKYAWDGPTFTAWPDYGHTAAEYAAWSWPETFPQLEATYLRARYEGGVWIVELPVRSIRRVVLRAIPDPAANYVQVQDIRPRRIDGVWDGGFEAVGSIWAAPVYPESEAGDFTGFLWPAEKPIGPATPILKAALVWGAWWVEQYIRHEVPELSGSLIASDCTPQLR